ncbi:MAG: ImmA/IrrE family metallo-endopeptidase [Planctomycetaceae bacterium]|nr:MAG: ImmA/IrrE family metallo-endopeptidase [Planctomycetaceae bacterium]
MWCETINEAELQGVSCLVDQVLRDAAWSGPPVDSLRLARRLGMTIAIDARQEPRGRHVRLGGKTAIFVRPEPRPERLQWTVAHEIGESLAHRLEEAVGAADWGEAEREQRANLLATRLLLPTRWFERDARALGADLLALKARYATASHELIAWRLLDLDEPAVTTVIDQGRLTRRRSNFGGRLPGWTAFERECLAESQAKSQPVVRSKNDCSVAVWPVHEPGWRREIVRLVFHDVAE